jgi:uroporphyrinogen decarboxylase
MFNDILLRAIKGEKLNRRPVWLMRQAGRYLKEYSELKKNNTFLELCQNPQTIYDVTMLPVKILNVDGAILFSDILIILPAMGIPVDFTPSPVVKLDALNKGILNNLPDFEPEESLDFIMKGIDLLVRDLNIPLIGFCGSPFTIACYILNQIGGKEFLGVKLFKEIETKAFLNLMEVLTHNLQLFLNAQIAHGCKVIQVFDTWAGILSIDDYKSYVFPFIDKLMNSIENAHKIYFIKNGSPYYEIVRNLNIDVLSVDWREPLSKVNLVTKNKFVLQGNLDPTILLTDRIVLKNHIERIIDDSRSLRGHIFNLGHGLYPQSNVDLVKYLVSYVQNRKIS